MNVNSSAFLSHNANTSIDRPDQWSNQTVLMVDDTVSGNEIVFNDNSHIKVLMMLDIETPLYSNTALSLQNDRY